MKLYIIRHAEAVEKGAMPDEVRYLSSDGRSFFRRTCDTFCKKEVSLDLILSSPLVRAVQTAEILAERLHFAGELEALPELAEMIGQEELAELLARWPKARSVALVGHEPYLGRLVGELIDNDTGFSFQKGAGIALRYDADRSPRATFRWYAAGKKKIGDLDDLLEKEIAASGPAEEVVAR